MASPASKLVGNQCRLILPAHLNMLVSKQTRAQALAAEALRANARKLAPDIDIQHAVRVKLIGRLAARVACFLVKRTTESGESRQYKDLGEIMQSFVDKVAEETGAAAPQEQQNTQTTEKQTGARVSTEALESVDAMKDMVRQVGKLGFRNNAFVSRKKGDAPETWKITELTQAGATLRQLDHGIPTFTLELTLEDNIGIGAAAATAILLCRWCGDCWALSLPALRTPT